MGPLGGRSARCTTSAFLCFPRGTSARLGSHSGCGMIVQGGGAMYIYSSSTATVSGTDFTSCSAVDVRDGLATPHHIIPHHVPSTPRLLRPRLPYTERLHRTSHRIGPHRTHRSTPHSLHWLNGSARCVNGRMNGSVGRVICWSHLLSAFLCPPPGAPRPVSARTPAAA